LLARRRLISHLLSNDTVLLKGSRAMGLEQLVETMRQWATSGDPVAAANARRPAKVHS
jgi:hypothetical protein